MSRRASVRKYRSTYDSKYNNQFIGRLINTIMRSGKKSVAENIIYNLINLYAKEKSISEEESVEKIETVISKLKPSFELKSKRVGGATLSIPIEVRPRRATALAIRWFQTAYLDRKEKNASLRALGELIDIESGKGASLAKKENVHKMSESNKVYSHYRIR